MRQPSSETYTLTGTGLDAPLVLSDGFGAAVSRSLTAAQQPRTTAPGEFLLHGENGRLVARVARDGHGHARVWASDRGIGDATLQREPAQAPSGPNPVTSEASPIRRPDPPAATEGGEMPSSKSKTKTRSAAKRSSSTARTATSRPRGGDGASAAMQRVSTKDAVRDVLKAAGKPLPTPEIVTGVLATEGVALKGKTPGATIAAVLSVENAKGDGMFVRVEKGTYDLRERQGGASE